MPRQTERRVNFGAGSPINTFHEVTTPYSKVYGQHPSLFDFGRDGEMKLTDAGVAEELRKEEDDANRSALVEKPSSPKQKVAWRFLNISYVS